MTRTRRRPRRPQRPKLRYPATERKLYILIYEFTDQDNDDRKGKETK